MATWGELRSKRMLWLGSGWMIAAALVAVYLTTIPLQRSRINEERATGLGDTSWQPHSFWRQSPMLASRDLGIVGGVPQARVVDRAQVSEMIASSSGGGGGSPESPVSESSEDRKLVRTATMDVVVRSPADAAEQIRQLAERAGGFLVSSNVNTPSDSQNAEVVVRVPVARFEEIRNQIRKLALRVEGDRLEAQDITRDYVDREARLRNLRAQETQYLAILKHAATVKDTLEVSDKLNQVRGSIEQEQAEFDALSKQVETVALTVTLSSEVDTQVFGLHWRPLYRLKLAARDGLNGLADYTAAMAAFAFFLPTVLLWLATILAAAAVAWRILRWAGKKLFGIGRARLAESTAKP